MTDWALCKRANADCRDYSNASAKFDWRSQTIFPRKRSFRCTRVLYIYRADTRFALTVNGRSKTSYRRKWVDIFYSDKRRDQILRFIYRGRSVGCEPLFVISLPFPICPVCNNSNLPSLTYFWSVVYLLEFAVCLSIPWIEFILAYSHDRSRYSLHSLQPSVVSKFE